MKIRNGFVSNSSSSSFVIIGFEVNESMFEDILKKVYDVSEEEIKNNSDNLEELLLEYENDFTFLFNEETGAPKGKKFIGKRIAYALEESGTVEVDVEEITKTLNEVKKKLNTNNPLKIITGNALS